MVEDVEHESYLTCAINSLDYPSPQKNAERVREREIHKKQNISCIWIHAGLPQRH